MARNLALAFLIGIRFRMGKQGKPRKGGGYSPKREASVDSRAKLAGSLSVTYPRYNGEMDAVVYQISHFFPHDWAKRVAFDFQGHGTTWHTLWWRHRRRWTTRWTTRYASVLAIGAAPALQTYDYQMPLRYR